MGQLIDQPKLGHILHPGSDQRNELSRDEKLKITVLHCAKARGGGRADRCAVTLQNIFPPLVGCRRRDLVTMPREESHCQRGAEIALRPQTPDWVCCGAALSRAQAMERGAASRGHPLLEGFVELERFSSALLPSAVSCGLSTFLLARRIRRATHMQMAQIPQRRPVLIAHALGEPRIIQPLIPR